jgi:NADH-quinone oxidoreductase subunit K
MHYYLLVGTIVFFIGFIGTLIQRYNLIAFFFSLELMFLGISLNFVTFSFFNQDWRGSLAVLLLVGVAAAESALGLSIIVALYRLQKSLSVFDLANLYD